MAPGRNSWSITAAIIDPRERKLAPMQQQRDTQGLAVLLTALASAAGCIAAILISIWL
jgi:hypothetical protein